MHEHERAMSALHFLDPGIARDDWVKIGMAAKAAGISFEEFDAWSSAAHNYGGEADTRTVWKSITDGGIKAGTLYAMVRAAGWREEKVVNIREARLRVAPAPAAPSPSALAQALSVWNAAEQAKLDHWYIANKRMLTDGLRVYRGPASQGGIALDGALIIPAWADDGSLATLQFVTPQKKLNMAGLPVAGFHSVGGKPAGEVFVCEGIGAAHSCHQATRKCAVSTFGSGNTDRAVAWLSSLGCKPVIVADKGKESQAAEIARGYDCRWVEMPADAPNNYDINDVHVYGDLSAVAARLAQARGHARKYQPLSADMLMALPPVRWRIKGVMPESGIGVIGGQSTAGKSFAALEMALRIAQGGEFFGHRCYRTPVIYLALEGAGGFAGRLRAWRNEFGTIPDGISFIVRQAFSLASEIDRSELERTLKDMNFDKGVVIIDTLAQAALGMEENTSEGMGAVIDGMQAIQSATGGLVLAVHHVGKDNSKGLRGHSSLFAALDVVMEIVRDGDSRSWKIAKNKDGRETESYGFELADVQIGEDYDGDAITSCVVRAVDLPEHEVLGRQKLTAAQQAGFDAIGNSMVKEGKFGKAGAPPTRPCMELETAIAIASSRLTCEPKRRISRSREILQALIGRGMLVCNEDWVWLP